MNESVIFPLPLFSLLDLEPNYLLLRLFHRPPKTSLSLSLPQTSSLLIVIFLINSADHNASQFIAQDIGDKLLNLHSSFYIRDWPTLFVKNQRVNIFSFVSMQSLSHLLNSAAIAQEQPQTIHEWVQLCSIKAGGSQV